MASIYDWSTTPGNNATADADINWSEGMFPSVVNDSARMMMARLAEWVKDQGILTATGSANAITLATSNATITTAPHGMTVSFKAAATNTGAVTLALNGGGSKPLRKVFAGDTDATGLDAGDITAKGVYVAHFDSGANSGAGAWILINPANAVAMINQIAKAGTKSTPVDDDAVVITDSADSGKTKRVLWSSVKSTLKNYFDTLYAASADYLLRSGGTMTGFLTLNGNPSANLHAATKQFVDSSINTLSNQKVSLSGDTMTGELINRGPRPNNSAGQTNTGQKFTSYIGEGTGLSVSFYSVETVGTGNRATIAVSTASGTSFFQFYSGGNFNASGAVYAGSAALFTDGNVGGSKWAPWGSNYAFDAINSRIESRSYDRTRDYALSTAAPIGFCIFAQNESGSIINNGGSVSGSSLRWASAGGRSSNATIVGYGTWMNVGDTVPSNTAALSTASSTLFKRVA